jgi:hypothetical protein
MSTISQRAASAREDVPALSFACTRTIYHIWDLSLVVSGRVVRPISVLVRAKRKG